MVLECGEMMTNCISWNLYFFYCRTYNKSTFPWHDSSSSLCERSNCKNYLEKQTFGDFFHSSMLPTYSSLCLVWNDSNKCIWRNLLWNAEMKECSRFQSKFETMQTWRLSQSTSTENHLQKSNVILSIQFVQFNSLECFTWAEYCIFFTAVPMAQLELIDNRRM